ncbi:ATP-binding protein [uncultured Chryseobacterium sp.]|uniref:sensor histidine kinase n=1 Tax=uncultured Chryseobacterium sp. TaxID=259322 RepID=UPI0025CBF85A|nr:ATP-binding protein [uncultured Chryseobacterium sp.]
MQQTFILSNRLLLFIFVLICLPLCSQNYSLTHYNTDNGLPQNSVKDIVKDKYGFIWLTTENGVVRYDGSVFLAFKDFPINNQRFTFFYGNVQKDSVFAGAGYQTVLLHERTAKVLKNVHRFGFKYKYNRERGLSESYNYHPNQGNPFYMAMKDGCYFFTDSSITHLAPRSSKETSLRVKTVYKNKRTIFTLNEKLFHIDYQSGKVYSIVNGKIAAQYDTPIVTDKNSTLVWSRVNNSVYIIKDQNIYSLSFDKGRFTSTFIADAGNINLQQLSCIFYDKIYRKLYLGSSIEGLTVLSFHQFSATKEKNSGTTVFYSTLPYNNTSIITPKGQIYNRDGMLGNRTFTSDSQYFMSHDPDNNIIVQDWGKLYTYLKSSSFSVRNLAAETNSTVVDFLYDDKRYYTVTRPMSRQFLGGSLYIYKDRSFNTVERVIHLDSEPTRLLRTADFLWIGTIHGLVKISLRTFKIKKIEPDKDIYIRNIIFSSEGDLWITTLGKGFYLVKNDKLIRMPLDPDKNLLSAHTILEDQRHFFWIPTNNGLYRVRENNLLEFAGQKKQEVHYYRYTKDAGFNTNEFNGGSNICGNILNNGDFVLPSLNGLVFFNPLKTRSTYPKNFYLERALIDGKEMLFSEKLTVGQEIQKIDLFIDIPYFANRNNIVIKLNRGSGETWENIEQGTKVTLFNPSYGDHLYTFRILMSDNETYMYKKIHIVVTPYFYQRAWFKALCIILLLLLIMCIVKIRTRLLKKKNRMLEDIIDARTKKLSAAVESLEKTKNQLNNEIEQQKKLIGTITHDIATPIRFIAFAAQDILENDRNDKEKLQKILTSISKSSGQLYNFTLALKEYADLYNNYRSDKKEVYKLYDLIEEKKELFGPIAGNSNTAIRNGVDPDIYLDVNRNTLSVIIHNLLDNAVKFTKNGHITIESEVTGDSTAVTIKDNGIGMSPSQIEYYTSLHKNIDNEKLLLQKYGMGLHLVLQLIHILGGKIELENNIPSGIIFRIIVKNRADE